MSRVAILVAFHNDGATVTETVRSLQGEPDTELVLVDDGSTDEGSVQELTALAGGGLVVLRQEGAGPSAAWMRGLAATSAPYVMPFSSDDLIVRGATGRLADALDANPDAAAAWGDFETFGAATAYIPTPPVLCPWLLTFVNAYPGIALFRRDTLDEVGGWQLGTGIEDWDLWLRLAATGRRGVRVPSPVFRYRRDAGGRFQGRVRRYDPFYDELRQRNAALFLARSRTRRLSPAPFALKLLLPIVDRLPFVSRLLKVQLADALTLLFWSGGVRQTLRIVFGGLLFRARLLRG